MPASNAQAHLFAGLADSGKDNAIGRDTGRKRLLKFAAGHHIGTQKPSWPKVFSTAILPFAFTEKAISESLGKAAAKTR